MNIIETSWKWNGGLSTRASTQYIALHHAAAKKCSANDVDAWHKGNGWIGIGYHFFVRKDGTIYRGRPLWALGAHVSGKNNVAIGICAEGDYSKEKAMPQAQKLALAELLDYLISYHYPQAKIVGHGEIGASACPGANYPLYELKNYKKILAAPEAPEEEEEEMTKADVIAIIKEYEESKAKAKVGTWSKEAFEKATEKGILDGTAPQGTVTREMLAVVLDRTGQLDK